MCKYRSIAALLSALFLGAGWDLNDVSYLLPLPAGSLDASSLRAETEGGQGALLPPGWLALLPALVRGEDAAAVLRELRVVGIRIDPKPEIRMVWQPVFAGPEGAEARDAAAHSFYRLTRAEFEDLKAELQEVKGKYQVLTEGLPLGVHPGLAAQGLSRGYGAELRRIILKYTGGARLTRLTFVSREVPGTMWDFGGFEDSRRMVIPRVGTRLQSFVNMVPGGFRGGARPAPEGDDTFNAILTQSTDFPSAGVALLRKELDAVHRIENPRIHTSETVDCASCHAAQPARAWAERLFPGLRPGESEFRFRSRLNLENRSASREDTRMIRAFGYDGSRPAISQRAIHESAAVAESL